MKPRKKHLPSLPPTQQALEVWVTLYLKEFATGTESTLRIKHLDLNAFLTWFRPKGPEVWAWTPGVTQDYLNALPHKPRTKNRIRAHLNTFATWLLRHIPLEWHPLDGVKGIPVAPINPKRLSKKQLENMRKVMTSWFYAIRKDVSRFQTAAAPLPVYARPYRDRAIVELLLGTGMRIGALAKLDVDQFKPRRRQLFHVQEKGGRVQNMAMTQAAATAVQAYLKHERPADAEEWGTSALFLSVPNTARQRGGSGRMSYASLHHVVSQLGLASGIPELTPHWFRHHMAFELLEKHGFAAVVAQLGHMNPSTTLAYTQMTTEDLVRFLD